MTFFFICEGRSPYGERGLKFFFSLSEPAIVGGSLSLRRAWIEMDTIPTTSCILARRSPYGERGLKLRRVAIHLPIASVALLTESVD